MGARRYFRTGGRALKRPTLQKIIKICAITVLRGLRGMLPRENFNNGAPYDILMHLSRGVFRISFRGGGGKLIVFGRGDRGHAPPRKFLKMVIHVCFLMRRLFLHVGTFLPIFATFSPSAWGAFLGLPPLPTKISAGARLCSGVVGNFSCGTLSWHYGNISYRL